MLSKIRASRDNRIIPLRSNRETKLSGAKAFDWPSFLERVTQLSFQTLSFNRNRLIRDLESAVFLDCLSKLAKDASAGEHQEVPELRLFSNPLTLFTFQLKDRRYVCSHYQDNQEQKPAAKDLNSTIHRLSQLLSPSNIGLEDPPTKEELFSILFDHLDEFYEADKTRVSPEPGSNGENEITLQDVHSARRSAIKNWQDRVERHHRESYEQQRATHTFYCYPVIQGAILDGAYLVLVMVTPLDKNFVDEMVMQDHRVAEISLLITKVGNVIYTDRLQSMMPLMKQALARVLFTNMLLENSQVLSTSFTERSAILQHWINTANDGIRGILGEEEVKSTFDALQFCEAIVRKILCAEIPGIKRSEVYPFDRVFIFREAGTSSQLQKDTPIECLVLESSILSNNPADRGMYLTRRDRRIRGTEDYECDPSKKKIDSENIFNFYIRGYRKDLVLSGQAELSPETIETALHGSSKSTHPDDAINMAYKIGEPELNRYSQLSSAIYNLFGRLIEGVSASKKIPDPLDKTGMKGWETETFAPDFERHRMSVLEKVDADGLYFIYGHGLNLKKEAPLLNQLQNAYFNFLSNNFQKKDERYRRDAARQDNMKPEDIKEFLRKHSEKRKMDLAPKNVGMDREIHERTKVVFISFSWELHDENTRILNKDTENRDDDEEVKALLGPEYTYTMILVADQDPEKSMAKLQAERGDLKLFFKILMRRIWMEKLREYEYLEKKSSIIGTSLDQFIHRVKGFIKEDAKRQELSEILENIKVLTRARKPPVSTIKLSDPNDFYLKLIGKKHDNKPKDSEINDELKKITKQIQLIEKKCPLKIEILPNGLPTLEVIWSEAVVREAFNVIFKNACEAAFLKPEGGEGKVKVMIHACPKKIEKRKGAWFLDIIVDNTGGPISAETLGILNSPEPKQINPNNSKKGSTGYGVFLARYQLQNVIGSGSDITFENVGNSHVHTRLRLPASLIEQASSATKSVELPDKPPEKYILYVEDDRAVFDPICKESKTILKDSRLELIHTRSMKGAEGVFKHGMPQAAIMDMTIYKDDEGSGIATAKYGEAMLNSFMKHAAQRDKRPPIWVVTGEDESTVRDRLPDVESHGYTFVPLEGTDIEELYKSGVISVFMGKKGKIKEYLHGLSNHFGTSPEIDRSDKIKKLHAATPTSGGDPKMKLLRFDDPQFLTNLENAAQYLNRKIVIVEADCDSEEQVHSALFRWFQHPGLPDVEFPDLWGDKLFRLTDHVMHSNILLALVLGESCQLKLDMRFQYWAMSRNVWFSGSPAAHSEISNRCKTIRNMAKGPLSVMRHDFNGMIIPGFDKPAQPVVTVINRLEGKLSYDEKLQRDLDSSLGNGNSHLLKTRLNREDMSGHKAMDRDFDELDREIIKLIEMETAYTDDLRTHRNVIHQLRQYLGELQ